MLRPRACCACWCWCTSCHSCPQRSSRCCCRQVVLRSHFVRELLYQEVFSLQKHWPCCLCSNLLIQFVTLRLKSFDVVQNVLTSRQQFRRQLMKGRTHHGQSRPLTCWKRSSHLMGRAEQQRAEAKLAKFLIDPQEKVVCNSHTACVKPSELGEDAKARSEAANGLPRRLWTNGRHHKSCSRKAQKSRRVRARQWMKHAAVFWEALTWKSHRCAQPSLPLSSHSKNSCLVTRSDVGPLAVQASPVLVSPPNNTYFYKKKHAL